MGTYFTTGVASFGSPQIDREQVYIKLKTACYTEIEMFTQGFALN